jgi:molecular chaperone IbpA
MNALNRTALPLLYVANLGLAQMNRLFDDLLAQPAKGFYPPFDIVRESDNRWTVSFAVAGFAPKELSVNVEDQELVVAGRKDEEAKRDAGAFLHRGIASRSFQRRFLLGEGVEVLGAELANGLLRVTLERKLPERETREVKIAVA